MHGQPLGMELFDQDVELGGERRRLLDELLKGLHHPAHGRRAQAVRRAHRYRPTPRGWLRRGSVPVIPPSQTAASRIDASLYQSSPPTSSGALLGRSTPI